MQFKNFKIKERGPGEYYGFTLDKDHLYLTDDGSILHNSGKSVLENSFISHVSHFSDYFMAVGIDCKKVEFSLLSGVKGIKGVALDPLSAAAIAKSMQKMMMNRFEFMQKYRVQNIYDIPKDTVVDYYTLFGNDYQFDELFEIKVDLEESNYSSREYKKMLAEYPEKRVPKIISIEEIYSALENGTFKNIQMKEVRGYNSFIKKGDIVKTSGIFFPKVMLLIVDEMNELTSSEDYQVVDEFKQALGSVSRLGRAGFLYSGSTLYVN